LFQVYDVNNMQDIVCVSC